MTSASTSANVLSGHSGRARLSCVVGESASTSAKALSVVDSGSARLPWVMGESASTSAKAPSVVDSGRARLACVVGESAESHCQGTESFMHLVSSLNRD